MEKKCFEKFFSQYFDDIARYCLMLTKDREESLDIAQEVFIRAASEKRLCAEGFNAKAWLYRVARNEVMSFFRRFYRKLKHQIALDSEIVSECRVCNDEQWMKLNSMVDSLPVHYRDALYLKYYEDMSLEEIAEISGVPEGTVKSRLAEGRKKLKEMLGEEF